MQDYKLTSNIKACQKLKSSSDVITHDKILAFEVTKISFLTLQKLKQLHFTKSHLCEKMYKMVVLLWILFPRQFGYMHEKIQIIWNCTTYRKKIVSRKK